ncbi:MAG: 1-phosphatidylinositol-3-phosphate 5-kinase [Chrysothrix sp. TS-e1954]|nr:MAG: 1-phosphatidylinositol-3-phosphate 5-kinase [Chrysothrix sp. TS-e1954]
MAEEASSPASSTPFLPQLGLRSRRGSLASISSTHSQLDKDVLAHALDEIHSSASRTQSLTTFNEFSAPPASASGLHDRDAGNGLVPNSLGGLYARLRSSVSSGSRDRPASSSPVRSKQHHRSPAGGTTQPRTPHSSPLKHTEGISSLVRAESSEVSIGKSTDAPNATKVSAPVTPIFSPNAFEASQPDTSPSPLQIKQSTAQVPEELIDPSVLTSASRAVKTAPESEEALKRDTEQASPLSQSSQAQAFKNEVGADTGHDRVAMRSESSEAQHHGTTGDSASASRSADAEDEVLLTDVRTQDSLLQDPRPPTLLTSNRNPPTPRGMLTRLEADPSSNSLMQEMRRKVLSKDFWMKDENARVCFNCGDNFSAFRRKHHCRMFELSLQLRFLLIVMTGTCGQIYDAKCTVLISGGPFGLSVRLRVCRTCENIILGDDSSDDFLDDEPGNTAAQTKQIRFSDLPPDTNESHAHLNADRRVHLSGSQPSSSTVSSHRPYDLHRRQTASSGGDRTPVLARPTSSKSLRSLNVRPHSSSQRFRRPRHQHMRSLGMMDSRTPDQRRGSFTERLKDRPLPAFHTDAIIDPDLAPFLSDEGSSDDEPSMAARLLDESEEVQPSSPNGAAGLRKPRPRPLSRSFLELSSASRDADAISITSTKTSHPRRHLGNRSMSVGSVYSRQGPTPRVVRSENLFTDYDILPSTFQSAIGRSQSSLNLSQLVSGIGANASECLPRSTVELGKNGMNHVKIMLKQLLEDSHIDRPRRWEKVLIPILLQCTEAVDPNIQRGDDIDIRHYIKIKKAAGGSPHDSTYVSGVVFTKNVALKGMPRTIKRPRILIVSFPLVYARHQSHFMSLEPVIAQESEFLRHLVDRIMALKPTVVFCQRRVSGVAIQFLQAAGVAVAYNVKESVLHAIARCTQTRIVSSLDKLAMDSRQLGTCQSFDLRTFLYSGIKKTLIVISGCQQDLGCTILLRGGSLQSLTCLKRITEFMCYVVYNLKLETCLMRDQYTSLTAVDRTHTNASGIEPRPSSSTLEAAPKILNESDQPNSGSARQPDIVQSDSGTRPTEVPSGSEQKLDGEPQDQQDVALPLETDNTIRRLQERILSTSPSVKFPEPYLLLRSREQEQHMAQLRDILHVSPSQNPDTKIEHRAFDLLKPEMIDSKSEGALCQMQGTLKAIRYAAYTRAAQNFSTLKQRWETYVRGSMNPFDPMSHQQIVVLFSSISTSSSNACEGPDLLSLAFYEEHEVGEDAEPDVPLGEYVERLCHQAELGCTASQCDKKMIDHHRQYVHGDGQISIYLAKHQSKIRDMENTILMWSRCNLCGEETPVIPMSRKTWKYSFAKYLETSFWSTSMKPRAGLCPHDVHTSHTRFFGFEGKAVRLTYEKINLIDVIVPRSTVSWKVEKDVTTKNQEFRRIENQLLRFLHSVSTRIKGIRIDTVSAARVDDCKAEIDRLKKRVDDDRDFMLAKLRDKYSSSAYYEIIPLNRAVRAMQEKVADWDAIFTDFEKNYFPSEKDIRKLAAEQLKNAYLGSDEKLDDAVTYQTEAVRQDHIGSQADKPEGSGKAFRPIPDSSDTPDHLLFQSSIAPSADLEDKTEPSKPGVDGALSAHSRQASEETAKSFEHLDLAIVPATPEPRVKSQDSESFTMVSEEQAEASSKDPLPLSSEVVAKLEQLQSTSGDKDELPASNDTMSPKASGRRDKKRRSPAIHRSQTQPGPGRRTQGEEAVSAPQTPMERDTFAVKQKQASGIPVAMRSVALQQKDAKVTDRISSAAMRTSKAAMQSMIPRAVNLRKSDSRVSALAKHFEQMSREFERERLRERLQRVARMRQTRVLPTASFRPVVEIFKDADEAVKERDQSTMEAASRSDGFSDSSTLHDSDTGETEGETKAADSLPTSPHVQPHDGLNSLEEPASPKQDGEQLLSYPGSLAGDASEMRLPDEAESTNIDTQPGTPNAEPQTDAADIPKADRSSLMKMLTSFWSERTASGWAPLEYPLTSTDHIFADSDVIVREDEPSSLIAFAMASGDYKTKLSNFRERLKDASPETEKVPAKGKGPLDQNLVERALLGKTATHMRYQFQGGTSRMQCKVFFSEAFDAIRRRCEVADRFVESLSRCVKWDSRGGKTKSLFLKTLDERFVIKSLSAVETTAFLKFAPDYFDYMSKCLFHGLPTALAKILGFFQVVIKNPSTDADFNYFLLVMENVFYEGPSNRVFDLKGSMRNRKVQSTGEKDEVLLDENLLDYIFQSPIYIRNHSNSFLASSISNDTLFCSKQNVMDYSLIVGLYDDRQELSVGIIDYIRTYTWDKKLESWIKDRGKHKPTVRSPKDYRNRFRRSISRYFPLAPSCWQVFGTQRTDQPPAWWEDLDVQEEQEAGAAPEDPEAEREKR